MDPHSNTEHDDTPDSGRPPVRRDEEMKNAVAQWTPEDASRFLSAAIHEAQRPLADALRHRPVSTPVLALIIALLVVAGAAIGWILSSQLEKSEHAAETARRERESAVAKSFELQSKTDTLSMRLKAEQEQHERTRTEYTSEAERLRTESAGLRDNENDLKRTRTELARHRRQNELLRSQISGLEMEKQALARQLDAVKALMLADDDSGEETVVVEEPPIPGPAAIEANQTIDTVTPPAESAIPAVKMDVAPPAPSAALSGPEAEPEAEPVEEKSAAAPADGAHEAVAAPAETVADDSVPAAAETPETADAEAVPADTESSPANTEPQGENEKD